MIKFNNNRLKNVEDLFYNFEYFTKLNFIQIQLKNNLISEISCFENKNVEEVTFELDYNEVEKLNKFFKKVASLKKIEYLNI